MNLRKRDKEINGEEAMQSMTDIIFILLMFFMMTSTLVHPSALNLSLPSSPQKSSKPAVKERLTEIGVTATGNFIFDGKVTEITAIKEKLLTAQRIKTDLTIVVAPDRKAPVEKVVEILDFTQSKNITSILAADAE